MEQLVSLGLRVLGGFHPAAQEPLAAEAGTVLLIGPDGDRMWPVFTAAPEYHDGAADPLDRWSKRVLGALAAELGAQAVFPSDGPPYPPFYHWALRSGQSFATPMQLLVHAQAGLWVSFRGALLVRERVDVPARVMSPCIGCKVACHETCPAGAMRTRGHYDVPRCKEYLRSSGSDCMERGCSVRRACPLSKQFGQAEAQSAFHMEAFL